MAFVSSWGVSACERLSAHLIAFLVSKDNSSSLGGILAI